MLIGMVMGIGIVLGMILGVRMVLRWVFLDPGGRSVRGAGGVASRAGHVDQYLQQLDHGLTRPPTTPACLLHSLKASKFGVIFRSAKTSKLWILF